MDEFELSPHAIDRITRGDSDGLRTLQSPNDILEILNSGKFVWDGDFFGYCAVFYSEQDGTCLVAWLKELGEHTHRVRTIERPRKIGFMTALMAERIATGERVFSEHSPPVPRLNTSALCATMDDEHTCCLFSYTDRSWSWWRYRPNVEFLHEFFKAVGSPEKIMLRGFGWRYDCSLHQIRSLLVIP